MKIASVLRRALLIPAGLAAGLLAVELTLRVWPPASPLDSIRSGSSRWGDVRLHNGTVIWGTSERENRDCVKQHPERTRILFFGDSIPYGVNVPDGEVFTELLESSLNARFPVPGVCVLNFAQPAFGFDQSFAIAQDEIPALHPALVFWGTWNEERLYRLLGDTAFNVSGLALRPNGFPSADQLAWVPDSLNAALFVHSLLYRAYLLAHVRRATPRPPEEITAGYRDTRLIRVPALARAAGAKLTFFLATFLDKPFAELLTDRRHENLESALTSVATSQGAEFVRLQDLLAGEDYRAVRLDECCHFNAAGHAALAKAFEKIVVRQLKLDTTPE